MFEGLTQRLEGIFRRLRGQGILQERDVDEALREVRLALLEADVHFRVVKAFLARVRERAVGQEVLQSLTPGQQVVKIVYEELCHLMGDRRVGFHLASVPPTVVMLVGLQGSGKTTTAGKLAQRLRREGRKVLLVPADLRRPAAVDQLKTLGDILGVSVLEARPGTDPVAVCEEGVSQARRQGLDVVILDTAGRLHIDEDLMAELQAIRDRVSPHEVLLVADAMTGQDAVQMATRFHEAVGLTGVILTKLDGDARGGAVLSIRQVTGVPVKWVGTGERLEQLEPFHPDRMASRILGMGDVLTLIEKAQETVSREEALRMQKKILEEEFTLEDFREQIRQVRRMGGMVQILQWLPGGPQWLGRGVDEDALDRELRRVEAIINSMTPEERRNHTIINGSRRRRIARGSGTRVEEVNRLLKQFAQARKMMKKIGKMKRGPRTLRKVQQWLGGWS